jgi:hypothetical protein
MAMGVAGGRPLKNGEIFRSTGSELVIGTLKWRLGTGHFLTTP